MEDSLVDFFDTYGMLFQSLYAMLTVSNEVDFLESLKTIQNDKNPKEVIILDKKNFIPVENLEHYSACFLGGNLFFALLSNIYNKRVANVDDYPNDLSLDNLKESIIPGYDYHFYFETDKECHHFAIIYPKNKNDPPVLFSTYVNIPKVIIKEFTEDPRNILKELLQFDIETYMSFFEVPEKMGRGKNYEEINMYYRREPLYYPTFKRVFKILKFLRKKVSQESFSLILQKQGEIALEQAPDREERGEYPIEIITVKEIVLYLDFIQEKLEQAREEDNED